MTPERRAKIEAVLDKRQPDLVVVLDHIDDPHNIGAILRSCDAFGVMDVHLLYAKSRPPRMHELKTKSAASAVKWLNITKWESAAKLIKELKKKKLKIAVTSLTGRAVSPDRAELAGPLAFVVGNEKDGVSKEMVKAADLNLRLSMSGFIQSLNVSVATALLLYEAYRQREKKGLYAKSRMKKAERSKILKRWSTL